MISNTDRMSLLKEEMKLLRKQQKEEKQKKIENLISLIGSALIEKAEVNIKKEEEIAELLYYIRNIENKENAFVFDNEKYKKYVEQQSKSITKKR